ncbi:hypothetical protein ANCCAN_12283 [Ancylostoma caninum]|uniref:Uncharacterized protein n=1 Tax=Ancylostoma caninum TaxID=29170 RepID=A0A368GBK2_ANCCA|nr:hypothetical protein ANCCAN_12283 [Ancylostoma caninum]
MVATTPCGRLTVPTEGKESEFGFDDVIKRRFPCKPDCDKRIFPHCTEECKCDYLYPAVQRFCNPPPLPLFLNTCRLWYNGCPKYAQYHYASQYIYSKAEKGKKLDPSRTIQIPTTFLLVVVFHKYHLHPDLPDRPQKSNNTLIIPLQLKVGDH